MSITDAAVEAELRGRLDQLWGWAKAGKQTDPHDPSVEYYLMDTENVAKFTDHVLDLLEALKPVVVDREAAREQIKAGLLPTLEPMIRYLNRGVSFVEQSAAVTGRANQATEDVLAALYPKATEGKT